MGSREYPTSIHLTRLLRMRLKKAAREDKRSLSSQIRFILDEWMNRNRPDPTLSEPPDEAVVEPVIEQEQQQ